MVYNRIMGLNTQIECFLRIAELGQFNLAASALHITPTAVSKHIKNLEAAVGEALFIRTTRTVSLTEIGRELYERYKNIDDQLQDIDKLIESKKQVAQGKLKVIVSTILSKQFVLKYLPEFLKKYPLIIPEIIFSEEDSALAQEDIDVIVGFPPIAPYTDQLYYRKMYTVKNILCASKDYIQQHGKINSLQDLQKACMISHTLRAPHYFLPLANGEFLTCPAPILTMNNFEALNQACLDGIGLFLTADLLVKDHLQIGKLISVLPNYQFRQYEIFIFYRKYNYELPKIRAFVDFYCER